MNKILGEYSLSYTNKKYYDFEKYQVKYRRKKVIEQIIKYKHNNILEIGCGIDPLFVHFNDFDNFVLIEPSPIFYNNAINLSKKNSNIKIYNNYFENIKLKPEFNFIVVSGLLHEIENLSKFLLKIRDLANEDTIIHINVPNAMSFHRLLAFETGLIKNVYIKSDNQIKLHIPHIFNLETLKSLIIKNGFKILDEGSFFIKPFTHSQMIEMLKYNIIDEEIVDGFDKMIKYMPKLGSEIYVNCKLKK